MTPLHKAAWEGHTKIVKHLLFKGADRNAVDNVSQLDVVMSIEE
jgi:ankyrin repeat protein